MIKQFKGNSGQIEHQRNFIDAVKSRDYESLNAEVAIGKATSEWCNLANIAFKCGTSMSQDRAAVVAKAAEGAEKIWGEALDSAQQTLATHGISMIDSDVVVSEMLTFDANSCQFTGTDADKANSFLKRHYRNEEFSVPVEV